MQMTMAEAAQTAFLRRTLCAKVIIAAYVVVNCLLLSNGYAGGFARQGFVMTSIVAGALLCKISGPAYTAFTLWIWFVAPFVRRITDFWAGWVNPSIVLLTPYLVTVIGLFALRKLLSRDYKVALVPTALIATGILAGMIVGFFRGSSTEVVTGALGWLAPIVFALYLMVKSSESQEYRRAVTGAVIAGAVVMAVYGIIQFVVAPEWDRYWLENVSPDLVDPSFGRPEPYGIRVFSMLNSPAVLAGELVMALLLLMSRSTIWLAVPVAVGLMLTQVRMAWIGLAAGLIALTFMVSDEFAGQMRRRASVLLLLIVLAVVTLTAIPIISEIVGDRMNTFSNLGRDESLTGRFFTYGTVLAYSASNPLGFGINQRMAFGDLALDGALEQLLLSLGWVGTLCFVVGVGRFVQLLARTPAQDREAVSIRLTAFVFLLMAPAANVFLGPLGLLTWIPIGLSLGALTAKERASQASDEQPVHFRKAAPSIA